MTKNNIDIRAAAKKNRITFWQIADRMGIQDSALSRKMRRELPPEEKTEILSIIDQLSAAKQKSEV